MGRKKLIRAKGGRRRKFSLSTGILRCLLVTFSLYAMFLLYHGFTQVTHLSGSPNDQTQGSALRSLQGGLSLATSIGRYSCPFRHYPPHRYYKQNLQPLPTFLRETEYIYGEYPFFLNNVHPSMSASPSSSTKLCVDQSEWHKPSEMLPLADGTNPSLLRIVDNPRLSPAITERIANAFGSPNNKATFLATICMTDSQCSWNDSPQEKLEYKLSNQTDPDVIQTVLVVLDRNLQVLGQTTIQTLIDAPFGRRIKPKPTEDGQFRKRTFKLDDARLFTYQQEIWVSYREGAHYGYDKQVLNKVHIEIDPSTRGGFDATLKASEVETLCCGRNMALVDNEKTGKLQALTWVDPITIVDVELRKNAAVPQRRLFGEESSTAITSTITFQKSPWQTDGHRRLMGSNNKPGKKRKSDFHGTDGFMVHLSDTQEFLGIGHFHRPPGRDANEYARFGHHYTHAFFTISDSPPFVLKRLSSELLLPSFHHPEDAEIIQFWSGLEILNEATLVLAYGINDCEAAAIHVDRAVLESLLRPVPAGSEVVDLIKPPF